MLHCLVQTKVINYLDAPHIGQPSELVTLSVTFHLNEAANYQTRVEIFIIFEAPGIQLRFN